MGSAIHITHSLGYQAPGVDLDVINPAVRKRAAGGAVEVPSAPVGRDVGSSQAGRLEGVQAALLPEPAAAKVASNELGALTDETVAIDIYSVMVLCQKCAQDMRNRAREVRQSEMEASVAESMNAADEIRNAAEKRFAAALAGGISQMVGGVVSLGLGVAGAGVGIKAAQAGTATQQAARLQSIGAALSSSAHASSTVIGGVGTMLSAPLEQLAAKHDAKRAEIETMSRVHDQSAQGALSQMQQMKDVIRDVQEKLGAIDRARSETVRGIAGNV